MDNSRYDINKALFIWTNKRKELFADFSNSLDNKPGHGSYDMR